MRASGAPPTQGGCSVHTAVLGAPGKETLGRKWEKRRHVPRGPAEWVPGKPGVWGGKGSGVRNGGAGGRGRPVGARPPGVLDAWEGKGSAGFGAEVGGPQAVKPRRQLGGRGGIHREEAQVDGLRDAGALRRRDREGLGVLRRGSARSGFWAPLRGLLQKCCWGGEVRGLPVCNLGPQSMSIAPGDTQRGGVRSAPEPRAGPVSPSLRPEGTPQCTLQ